MYVVGWGIVDVCGVVGYHRCVWCGGVSQMCVVGWGYRRCVWWGGGIVDVCGGVGYHRCV